MFTKFAAVCESLTLTSAMKICYNFIVKQYRKGIVMKKIVSILSLIMIFAMLFTACDIFPATTTTTSGTEPGGSSTSSTTHGGGEKPECDTHVDENDDSYCDSCGAEIPQKEVPAELAETTMYLVGDSTVCAFDDDYYYPRYGYGTQIGEYLSDKVTVVNLALSGRSSKSFLSEENYTTLKNSLKQGDFLIIGFGHNDQKSDDAARFTDASKHYTDPSSFGYHLYEYYIKLAQEVGAIPVLCTPIVRAKSSDDYSGNEGHKTATGDYAAAIREVGEAYGVDVIDLTVLTRSRYEDIGFDAACYYHAVIAGKYDTDGKTVVPDFDSVDKTHLNIYGAKYVAYLFAKEFSELDGWGGYVLSGIKEPTSEALKPNPDYIVPDYTAPDLNGYNPVDHFTTISDGWYGTAFGNTGGNPQSSSNNYIAKEVESGVFHVGQSTSKKGKFENASDGFAFLFRQVAADRNFTITVHGKVLESGNTKQAGFGLMLRDDCIIDQNAAGSINTNYVTAGILANSESDMYVNFYRENATLKKGNNHLDHLYAVGDEFTMTIERIGQSVTVTTVVGGVTYTDTYYDFDFFARDTGYMYVGMFANRGTVVEFSDVVYTDLGQSQGA